MLNFICFIFYDNHLINIFWFITFFNFYYLLVSTEVNFHRLVSGSDFRADECGQYPLVERPFTYFPDPGNYGGIGMCVDRCPNSTVKN